MPNAGNVDFAECRSRRPFGFDAGPHGLHGDLSFLDGEVGASMVSR
jgi:hypothetical protein